MKTYSLTKRAVAEFIGTFALVLFGCGTAVVTKCSTENYPGYLLTALAFGLSVVAMAYSIGNVSGCHINPAISVAKRLLGDMTTKEMLSYIAAQCLGALAGGAVLAFLVGKESGLGANALSGGSVAISIVIEVILTCIFVLVVIGVTSKSELASIAGLVIGGALTLVHILGIAFTGTSVNPARSLVAIIAGGEALSQLWVFIVAPIIGAILASIIAMFLFDSKKKTQNV